MQGFITDIGVCVYTVDPSTNEKKQLQGDELKKFLGNIFQTKNMRKKRNKRINKKIMRKISLN